ncbi:acylneuraminate cytidylyltransferase family protein [Microbulbifer sp. OS29]|uniref:Acylneuraminate cytidylyltransferase family protein n=1 Tax=Microbulbifer okhotskensis TaxID=2926617 RepID=A0A9X2EP97_9GAMM|nr:acylneuraminate cytidylyltransferase family protein [Microbulbifer okhotskensis]MCO1335932.1 acylneuraminate cytidylyltransferase family protein [Microbulbifer okhotskensis]
MNKNCTAIITARKGSKGLPGKNVRLLNGKPLVWYTVNAAIESRVFSNVLISTDCEQVASIGQELGGKVVWRPASLSGDSARSEDTVEHALRAFDCVGHYCLLQPTSPLRTSNHIRGAWNKYLNGEFDSLVSVIECDHSPFKTLVEADGGVKPIIEKSMLSAPRQELPRAFRINGALYFGKVGLFIEEASFFTGHLGVFEMDVNSSIDIDSDHDMANAEYLLESKQ